ncbi:putative methyltransferase [Thalassoglobus neptunius]|uniref:Putative methyltransferase n=1 Tax=Thalassoglobus neptunius TaxID=1938619 RepID=A0A5C5WLU4_9PLAN|nr:DNA methyltransferase [Thalassoglobus neptunius]TWT51764.1 putative methyltransferase [Thalassoglobus neptunius]
MSTAVEASLTIEQRPLTAITPYEQNPRINASAVEAVARSIKEFGFRQPIVVDEQGVIIVGHTRYKAAQHLKLDTVPVHVADGLSEAQIKAYRIADNQTATIAEWDFDLLPLELTALSELEFDLDLLGLTAGELQELLAPPATTGETDPDDVPEPPDEATTQPGDLWQLGRHRLLCGDSSSPQDLDRLLDGNPIHLVNMDPPYNVKVEPRSNNAIAAGLSSFEGAKHHQQLDVERHPSKSKPTGKKLRAKDRPLANDFVTDEEFDRLLDAWFGNAARVLEPGRAFYIWGGYANCANYPPYLKQHDLYFSQAIIWDKQHPVLTRKDFMGAHEWCQPPETTVLTPAGTSRLGALSDGDAVVSFTTQDSTLVGLREGHSIDVGHRQYHGPLYGVTVDHKQTWCTDGHLWTIRLSDDYARKWCVYLMRRGDWWRVGVTKMRTTWGFGLKGRLCSENGDEGWILSLHDSHADARISEQFVSVQYGIPQTCWKESPQAQRRQRSHVEELYQRLDLVQLERSACAALQAHHRSRIYPFVRNQRTRAKLGSRQSTQIRSCNLLPEIMEIPIPTRGVETRWTPIRAIDVQLYQGPVYSLGVSNHQHYVADGMVTHNCFYGWRTGAGHQFYGPNNATDLWHVKKVNPQSMVHLTEKPVELAVRAIEYSSKKGEHVLDLFGGSGSTLMGCEQSGRTAFLMELDPLYCDVIVQRWEAFTGNKAERVTGEVGG